MRTGRYGRHAPLGSPEAQRMAENYSPDDYQPGDEDDPRSPWYVLPEDRKHAW